MIRRLIVLTFICCHATLLGQAPVIGGVSGSLVSGQSGSVRAVVAGSNLTVTLRFGRGRQSLNEAVDSSMRFVSFSAWDAMIPASHITHEGVWAQVVASNPSGTVYYPSPTKTVNISVSMNKKDLDSIRARGAYPNGHPRGTYTLISMPVQKGLELQNLLGSQGIGRDGPTRWRLLTYDGTFHDETVIKGGKVYFFRNDVEQDPLLVLASGATAGGDIVSQVTLPALQWSIIPWEWPISKNITLDASKVGSLWTMIDGTWSKTTTPKPFGGYAIYNKTSLPLVFGDAIASITSKKQPYWSVGLDVESGTFNDRYNEAGVCAAEEVGFFNEPEPPAPDESLKLFFADSELAKASSFKPAGRDVYHWTFHVTSFASAGKAKLTFRQNSVPADFSVMLIDLDNNRLHDVNASSGYEFRLLHRNRFLLIGAKKHLMEEEIAQLALPENLRLEDAFPNPANPGTTIGFELKRSSNIRLEVFNTLGQRVRVLASDFYTTGHHSVRWDGRTDKGIIAASGVYFYRLTAGAISQTKKLLLIR